MWWQAASWAIDHEARLAAEALDDKLFRLSCAAVSAGGDVDNAWKDALAVYDASWSRRLPWLPPPDRSARPMRDMWVKVFGDPVADESVAAAVARTVSALTGARR